MERTLAAPPAEELVDDDEELEGLAVVVVVAADDVETPFLIADVFRRGAATACATILPRRAGSGAAALPLVVATVMKQLCELVRAKDAILERDKKKRVKKRASCFLCSLLSMEEKRKVGEKEKERERARARKLLVLLVNFHHLRDLLHHRDLLNRFPLLSLSLFLGNTKTNLSHEQKQE